MLIFENNGAETWIIDIGVKINLGKLVRDVDLFIGGSKLSVMARAETGRK